MGRYDALDVELACRAAREAGWLPARIDTAQTFFERLMGLQRAGRGHTDDSIPRILAFPHCGSVHTWLMRSPIDVAFYDAQGCIIAMHASVGPGHVLSCSGARGVLERITPAARNAAVLSADFQKSFAFSLDRSF